MLTHQAKKLFKSLQGKQIIFCQRDFKHTGECNLHSPIPSMRKTEKQAQQDLHLDLLKAREASSPTRSIIPFLTATECHSLVL